MTRIPILLAVLFLFLAYLLPSRGSADTISPEGAFLAPLEVTEPPAWALQRGKDEIVRNLDRLLWGSHSAMVASRDVLRRYGGGEILAPEILGRLEALGDSDPIAIAKLIAVLADEDPSVSGQLDEFIYRAHSPSALVTMAALRALAFHPDDRAIHGILARLNDVDLQVRDVARAALVKRMQAGDIRARDVLLDELESSEEDPDLGFVAALQDVGESERADQLLRIMRTDGDGPSSMVAWAILLRRGDQSAAEHFSEQLKSDDSAVRLTALRVLGAAGMALGDESWERIAKHGTFQEVLALGEILLRAMDEGHPAASLAESLFRDRAEDPFSQVRVPFTDALLARGSAWAAEVTRSEILTKVGARLTQTVDRVISSGGAFTGDLADVAWQRLEDVALRDVERAILLRLIAAVDPERAADTVVSAALGRNNESAVVSASMEALLFQLGEPGLKRLQEEVSTLRGASLFVRVANEVGSPVALPVLETIVLNESMDLAVREAALDCIVLLDHGPREEVLRNVAERLPGDLFRGRARLLFWNYL